LVLYRQIGPLFHTATLYEYDEEGKLIRVKKETEKGVMTIKENKNSTKKK